MSPFVIPAQKQRLACGENLAPAAQAFLDFLQTDACMEIFENVGFSRIEQEA